MTNVFPVISVLGAYLISKYGAYWRTLSKTGRNLFQSERKNSYQISKICNVSFQIRIQTLWCLALYNSEMQAVSFTLYFTYIILKASVRYCFWSHFLSPDDSPSKTIKMFFISYKKLFSLSRYSSFCISVFLFFSPCQPFFRGLSR